MGEISNGTRILLTEYLLKRLTDENHALSREELISKIEALGTTISSNTIKADIESIKAFNAIIKESQNKLVAPFGSKESGSIKYSTRQKKGAFIEETYYSDAQLILLARLLGKCLSIGENDEAILIEKVLADSSLYKINKYHLFDTDSQKKSLHNVLGYLEQIINAVNNYACVSFKKLELGILEGELKEISCNKQISIYPTNIEIKDNTIYVVGYRINSGEDLELVHYSLEQICELKTTRTPRCIKSKVESFKDDIWACSDPLKLEKTCRTNLEIRVYQNGSDNVFEELYKRFPDSHIEVRAFHQFVDVTIEQAVNDENLFEWFMQMSHRVEVFKPLELRNKIKEEVRDMYLMYRG